MDKMTPDEATRQLFQAVRLGSYAMARAALDLGANVNVTGSIGHDTPLHFAVAFGHTPIVQLLIDNGADVNAANKSKQSPLHLAVAASNISVVQLLTQSGANVDAKNDAKWTPRDLALADGYIEIAELLENAAKQQGHAGRITEERKDKGPPQIGG